jgi:hypothetical protein
MEKTFTYGIIVKDYGDEVDTRESYYTVGNDQLLDAIIDLVYEDDFYDSDNELCWNVDYIVMVKQGIKKFIEDNELLSDLVDGYIDELKDYFEEEAKEQYR